ncbi:hypothetical protein HI914_03593 [Erysiphe necator]|nr:hypothetical protein HI914_03593 [Erysiphe necator]
MGGIAIWCMHYIGNQAIILVNGQPSDQIKYNLGFTILSFILPITMAFLAFVTVGTDIKSVARVVMGGILNSLGILGMHYMGQAGITNYQCSYQFIWILGAVILSFISCTAGLSQFFLIRLSWKSSWWKRAACAFLIAAAVSIVHWLSSIGTIYQFHIASLKPMNKSYQIGTVIVITALSILGCLILVGIGIVAQRRKKKLTKTVQQLVLAVAIFDQDNKILVTSTGDLPLRKLTETWLERNSFDEFNIAHPVFLWMFETSQNWSTIVKLIPAMRAHIKALEIKKFQGINNILMGNDGIPINEYSSVFEELFCIKSADLANDLGQPLERIGILFDEIINTEQIPVKKHRIGTMEANASGSIVDLENEIMGFHLSGKGQIIFLVNRVGLTEAQRMKAAGYRFANVANVASILATKLQVNGKTLAYFIKMMQNHTSSNYLPGPGVYFSIFAIRASINYRGFEILARRDAKTQLPSVKVDIKATKDWHIKYLKTLKNMNMVEYMNHLFQIAGSRDSSYSKKKFAKTLYTSLKNLRKNINDVMFDHSLVAENLLEILFSHSINGSGQEKAFHVVFRIFLPIHKHSPDERLIFVPLDFFKTAQQIDRYSRGYEKNTLNYLSMPKSTNLCPLTNNLREESLEIPEELLESKHETDKSRHSANDFNNIKMSTYSSLPYDSSVEERLTRANNFVDELFESTLRMRKTQSQVIQDDL